MDDYKCEICLDTGYYSGPGGTTRGGTCPYCSAGSKRDLHNDPGFWLAGIAGIIITISGLVFVFLIADTILQYFFQINLFGLENQLGSL